MDIDKRLIAIPIICVAVMASIGIGVEWYKAGIQADVYRRQGIEMTTWEVMMGAKPAERTINIKNVE